MVPNWYLPSISFGPLTLYVWGMLVAAGFLVAGWLAARWAAAHGIDRRHVWDATTLAIVGGMVGGRLGHIMYAPQQYLADPLSLLRIWEGGLSSFGGFLGASLAVVWFVRRHNIQLINFSDLVLRAMPLGWFIGRLGCYSIHDHAGIPCSGALCVPFPDGSRRLDMGLLDGLLAFAIFVAALLLRKRLQNSGRVTAFVLIMYGAGRFLLDFLRAFDTRYAGLTPAQYGSMVLVMIGVVVWWRGSKHVAGTP